MYITCNEMRWRPDPGGDNFSSLAAFMSIAVIRMYGGLKSCKPCFITGVAPRP